MAASLIVAQQTLTIYGVFHGSPGRGGAVLKTRDGYFSAEY
jgi:hypothetical protein